MTAVGGEEAEEQEQEDGRSVDEEAAAGKPKVQAKARQSKAKHAKAESVQDVPLNAAGQAVQVAEGAGHATRIVGPLTVDVRPLPRSPGMLGGGWDAMHARARLAFWMMMHGACAIRCNRWGWWERQGKPRARKRLRSGRTGSWSQCRHRTWVGRWEMRR